MTDLNKLRLQVEKIAIKAGEIALSFQGDTSSVEYKDGFQESPVTAADLAVDAFLKTELTALNSSWGWLSEETVDDGNWQNKSYLWIVDPIDGTTGFVHFLEKGKSSVEDKNQRRQFSVSIALSNAKGEAILGVIYTPADARMMSASKGSGCFLNGTKLAENNQQNKPLSSYTFLASTSEMRRGLIDFLVPKLPLKTVGSSANKIALVATENNLITASVKPKCWWDVAAATCLITERGYTFSDLAGNTILFTGQVQNINGIIAAPASIYPEIYDLLPRATTAGYV